MSKTVNILVRGSISFTLLRDGLESIVGHCLTKSTEVTWDLYETDVLGIHISLYDEPDFVDDNHIPFSQYQFAIGIDTGGLVLEGDIGQNWYETFPLALASMIVKVVSCECIVVKNLQRITATFLT